MKTKLYTYQFDTNNPTEKAAYEALVEKLTNTPGRGHWMKTWGGSHDTDGYGDGVEIELKTEHIFSNQWDSSLGRVFDWYELAQHEHLDHIKIGYYLDITPEMVHIRHHTLVCRYTGTRFPDVTAPWFDLTQAALGCEYLKENELHLLRLKRVDDTSSPEPLTQEEKDFLLPLYIKAQTKGRSERNVKRMSDLLQEAKQSAAKFRSVADAFEQGALYLAERGITADVVFHEHTGIWNFGFRNELSKCVADELRTLLKDFPCQYKICESK